MYCCNKADTINKEKINKTQRTGREGQTLGLYRHAHVSLKHRVKSNKINLSEEKSAGSSALARTADVSDQYRGCEIKMVCFTDVIKKGRRCPRLIRFPTNPPAHEA